MKPEGHKVEGTANLFHALGRLRYENKERPLWADALCINQSDDVEKSRQVSIIGEIYTKTSRALLWLGNFDENDSVYSPMGLRPGANVTTGTSTSQPPPNTIDRYVPKRTYGGPCQCGDVEKEASCSWQTPQAFLVDSHVDDPRDDSPIMVHIYLRDRSMELEQVLIALHRTASHIMQGCCNEYDDHKDGFKEFFNEIAAIANLLEKPPNVHRLMVAFNLFRSRQATNPRDRVYALAGLGPGLSVDYTLSTDQVLRSSFRQPIRDSRLLDCMIRANEVNRSPNLPSWIPDLTAKCRRQDTSWIGIYEAFNANSHVEASLREASSPFNDDLELTGFQIDRIAAVGRPYFVSEQPPVVDWQDVMTRHCSVFGEHYPLGGTYDSAFWTTVMAGAIPDQNTGGHRRATSDDNAELQRTWHKRNIAERWLWLDTMFFVTERGLIGLGSLDTEARDYVFVLDGGRMPFILRGEGALNGDPSFSKGWFSYVGHAYVHGIMDGEAYNGKWERSSVLMK